MKSGKIYPLYDSLTNEEKERLQVKENNPVFYSLGKLPYRVGVKYTGEKRKPKKGEWYLSGACVAGYRAMNDLSTEYHIAELIKV